jgi:hypothetical protein
MPLSLLHPVQLLVPLTTEGVLPQPATVTEEPLYCQAAIQSAASQAPSPLAMLLELAQAQLQFHASLRVLQDIQALL